MSTTHQPVSHKSAAEFAKVKDSVTVLDLRTAAEVQSEYLGNCICLPVQELTGERFNKVLNDAGHKDDPVYLLCQSGKRAQMAVEKLQGQTHRPLVIIEGGLNALKEHGVQVQSSGRKTISLERQVRIAAGALMVLGAVLSHLVHPYFIGLSGFVGAGLMFAGITDTCGMAMCLAHMPWNKACAKCA